MILKPKLFYEHPLHLFNKLALMNFISQPQRTGEKRYPKPQKHNVRKKNPALLHTSDEYFKNPSTICQITFSTHIIIYSKVQDQTQ